MMIIILSPSKTLDLDQITTKETFTTPHFQNDASLLMKDLSKIRLKDIEKSMKLSTELAKTVKGWHMSWGENSHQCGRAMMGEAFKALDYKSLSKETTNYSIGRFYVLSGLYGALGGLDGISPYRLEMAQKFKPYDGSRSLNEFWAKRLPEFFNIISSKSDIQYLANLASDEYNKVVLRPELNLDVIDFNFKVETEKGLKNISVFAKQARGAMARYILENRIEDLEGLKRFEGLGYRFRKELSSTHNLTFTRTR